MFSMFTRMFNSFAIWFTAFENLGHAANHITTLTNEMAEGYVEEERVKRAGRLAQLKREVSASSNVPAIAA